MSSRQIEEAKRFISNIDSHAVMSIMDASEVRGKGFKPAVFLKLNYGKLSCKVLFF